MGLFLPFTAFAVEIYEFYLPKLPTKVVPFLSRDDIKQSRVNEYSAKRTVKSIISKEKCVDERDVTVSTSKP